MLLLVMSFHHVVDLLLLICLTMGLTMDSRLVCCQKCYFTKHLSAGPRVLVYNTYGFLSHGHSYGMRQLHSGITAWTSQYHEIAVFPQLWQDSMPRLSIFAVWMRWFNKLSLCRSDSAPLQPIQHRVPPEVWPCIVKQVSATIRRGGMIP